MCRVYFHQATMLKSNQKIGKALNYPSVQKRYSTSCKDIGGNKKKEQNSKIKTTTLMYCDSLKKKQQDKGGKSWCYTVSFMSMTISNLRATTFCFENKLLKQILNNVSILIAKKICLCLL